jgi:V-type H+-transporting ATPase subunit a
LLQASKATKMGSLYRSEEMRFCQMIVEKDAAFSCVAELVKKPYVQFKDLNSEISSFQRMFVRDIRRFDEMERKLRFLENQIRKDNITVVDNTWKEENDVMSHHEINQLEQTLADLERDVVNMNESDHQMKKNFLELKEWEAVLEKTDIFFQGGLDDAAVQEIEQAKETEGGFQLKSEKEPMGYTVGVIPRDKVNAFERVLWRACRRTAFVRHSEIEEQLENPDSGEPIAESAFIVFYNGDRLKAIIDKVRHSAKQFTSVNFLGLRRL